MAAIGLGLAGVGTAVLIGVVPGAFSATGTFAVGSIGLAALAILAFRSGVRTAPATAGLKGKISPVLKRGGSAPPRDAALRIPRLLFYAGAATVTLSSVRPALGLTLSQFFFIAAFGGVTLSAVGGRRIAPVPNGLVVGVGLFAIGGLISSSNASSPSGSVIEVLQAIYVMLLWVVTGATVLRTRPQFLIAVTLWTISAAFNGFAAFTQVAGFGAITEPLAGPRATGLNVHPNDLGGSCAVALIPALMLATSRFPEQGPWSGPALWRWAVLGLIAGGLVLAGSVTAMLAALVATVIWMIHPAVRAPGRLAVISALAFTLVAVMIAGGRVASPTERVGQVTSASGSAQTGGSGEARIRTVERAASRIADDPVVGVGFDGVGGAVNVIHNGRTAPFQVHSAPVAAWYEAGVLGLLGILIVAVTLARTAWRSLVAGDQNDLLIALAIAASAVAFAIIAITSPFVFQQYGWFTGVLLVAWGARQDVIAPVLLPGAKDAHAMPAMLPRRLAH